MLIAAVTEIWSKILYIFIALIALLIMITVHEFGHYSVGKLFKFGIKEFSIGFGKAIFKKKKKNGEIFSIRILPLGGYCAFEGEDEDADSPTAFNNKPCWQRILVLLAGVTFNFVFAMVVLGIYFLSYGYALPEVNKLYVTGENQAFEVGDVLYSVDGKRIFTTGTNNLNKLLSEDSAVFGVYRNGEYTEISATKTDYSYEGEDGNLVETHGFGIQVNYTLMRLGFFESLWRGIAVGFQIILLIFKTIGGLITGAIGVKGNLGGTITTISVMGSQVRQYGFEAFMNMLGVMSASIAFMNLLPFPALDGSRIVFVTIEWIRGKPLNRKVEGIINLVGLFLLIGLTITLDIINLV